MSTQQAPKAIKCNLCQGTEFGPFKARPWERCLSCGSLIRHRIACELYHRHGVLTKKDSPPYGTRVLHFAPENLLHRMLRDTVGAGYICADAAPENYVNAQCLKIFLPQDFAIFPDAYFDFILHNHVLEHIPGTFRDHLPGFARILKPGGKMIFSVPGPRAGQNTVEGGEHFDSDEQRIAEFGQFNHLKRFGKDLPEFLDTMPGGEFAWDGISPEERADLGALAKSNRFMIWTKAATDA